MFKNIIILFGIFCFAATAIAQSYNDSTYIKKKLETHPKTTRLSNGNVLYDFEKDFFGRLSLDLSGMSDGDTVIASPKHRTGINFFYLISQTKGIQPAMP
jgi:hypothetical protein